jgi:hypothetical protein
VHNQIDRGRRSNINELPAKSAKSPVLAPDMHPLGMDMQKSKCHLYLGERERRLK